MIDRLAFIPRASGSYGFFIFLIRKPNRIPMLIGRKTETVNSVAVSMQPDILNITDLRQRLQNGSRVREEHVWCLAKQTFPQLCSATNAEVKRFETLLQANALLDALFFAVLTLRPSISLEAIRRTCHGWMCSASLAVDGASSRKAVGRHADMEGALFIALLTILKYQRQGNMKTVLKTGEDD
ncbi:hypothetical protein RMR16_017100 [Agrobacterium sp. rho-13.3]|uniref:hypothetical protein n=1 Tax=Agrobacterium sp. rho-13.3 TaxID=3072980 RepID=UPI002A161677|nr:hypothetical protein [Agrobacterium sp. rho-13.3]MDX8311922.1 hypothetical protein [Agrobacterium sp. rho-13.3]